jgi:hypothetical protein
MLLFTRKTRQMATIRLLPPLDVKFQTLTTNGRNHSAAPGVVHDVIDFDADSLGGNGWTRVGEVGATAQRPVNPARGKLFTDTSVGAMIIFDGATWRNPATGAAV